MMVMVMVMTMMMIVVKGGAMGLLSEVLQGSGFLSLQVTHGVLQLVPGSRAELRKMRLVQERPGPSALTSPST